MHLQKFSLVDFINIYRTYNMDTNLKHNKMKHSVLLISGGKLVYTFSPQEMPSNNTIEGMKDFLIWQQSLKSFSVKEEDRGDFTKYVDMEDPRLRNAGVPIDYDLLTIFQDPLLGKKFVKINKNVTKTVVKFSTCLVCLSDFEAEGKDFPICGECLTAIRNLVNFSKNIRTDEQ
jgi:hypothetical protein